MSAGGGAFVAAAAAAACAARSSTEVGCTGACVPRYANVKLVTKNSPANTAVNFENKVLVPRAPNTVPDAPEPNPAPASAPLPRCSSTSADNHQCKQYMHTQNQTTQHKKISLVASGRSRANLSKLIGAQGSAAYQSTIDVGHCEKLGRVAGLDAAAV